MIQLILLFYKTLFICKIILFIKMTPAKAQKKERVSVAYLDPHFSKKLDKIQKTQFKISDKVRICKFKRKVLDKGWTEKIFVLNSIEPTMQVTHRINDLMGENVTGSFYEKELPKSHDQELIRIERVVNVSGAIECNECESCKFLG